METSVWSDLRQWVKAIIRHWRVTAGGSTVAVIFLVASIWVGGYWLRILSGVTLFVSFLWATFLAWRDEHRKMIGKVRRSILNKVVECSASENPDILGALIKVSHEFGSEEDVEWVCRQLGEHHDYDPFEILPAGAVIDPSFDGKRLKFLQDARVVRIGSLREAIEYLHSQWAAKNGLRPRYR